MAGASAELGSLLIRLGFNANTVRDGLNAINSMLTNTGNRAQQTGNQLNSAGVRGAAGFSALTRAAVGFTAVVTAGLAVRSFVKSVAEANKDMENLRAKFGMPASEISAGGKATELAGGTKEDMESLLGMITYEKQLYKDTGESGLLRFFNFLGISLNENIDAMQTFIKMREKLMERSGGDKSVAWARAKMMGIPEGAISLMLKSDSEFKALMAQGKANAMTDAESKSAQRIGQSFTDLEQKMESLGLVIMTKLEPTILKFNEWLGNAATWIENTLSGKGFKGLASEAAKAASWLNPIGLVQNLFKNEFETWRKGGETSIPFGDIPSFIDTFKNMDFFNGDLGDFLDENKFKSNPNFGRDFIERLQWPTSNTQSNINNTSSSTNVGEIKIYTQSQDQAGEIADRLGYLLASQSNTALS